MKKQFFRVKQLADQTFSRAGKTEALSDDLQDADRKVEFIRNACQATGKKLNTGLQAGTSQDPASKEKRLKKNADYILGVAMQESSLASEDDCLLKNVLWECGKVELSLAQHSVDHEANVEVDVHIPLQQLLDAEVPNILKNKRNLQKLILDMDSARTRYLTAAKQHGTRADAIKEEFEDAELKVEQCRDMLASDMFQLISRQSDLAEIIVGYAKLQRDYHQSALQTLQELLPELENLINNASCKPVFGTHLSEHLRVTGRHIALPLELCVCALLSLNGATREEGLFRVAAGSARLKRFKLSLDAGCISLNGALEYRDPHIFASALKSYLRELPEPLLTHALYNRWMTASRIQGESRLQAIYQVIQELPIANRENLCYVIKFLSSLLKHQTVNKMTVQNLAIVMAPTLLWPPQNNEANQHLSNPFEDAIGINMSTASQHSGLVDTLISYADWFFPDDVEFFVSLSRDSSLTNGCPGNISITETESDPSISSPGNISQSPITAPIAEIKRSQSNSSLSDHSSPPQGSPKPATRRKHKPAAPPVPPIANSPGCGSNIISNESSNKIPPPRPSGPSNIATLPRAGKANSATNTDPPSRPKNNFIITTPPPPPPPSVIKTTDKAAQTLHSNSSQNAETHKETQSSIQKCDSQPTRPPPAVTTTSSNTPDSTKESSSGRRSFSGSSGIVTVPVSPVSPTPPGQISSGGGTLERRKPHPPIAAPRPSINTSSTNTPSSSDCEVVLRPAKPAVPERPSSLQRPRTSSLENAVDIPIRISGGGEPSSPNPVNNHTRTMSDGGDIFKHTVVGGESGNSGSGEPVGNNVMSTSITRRAPLPPPVPPPPPPTQPASLAYESTDL